MNIFLDKQLGKDFNRPQYKKMSRKLKLGDTVFVKAIDRFGRNYDEVIQQWYYLTKKKKVEIVVLDMPLLDTRRNKELLGELNVKEACERAGTCTATFRRYEKEYIG